MRKFEAFLVWNFFLIFRPAIVVLLMSMVNEKQPFTLRCSVLYCFQSFLYKNEVGQSQIVQTLLPTSADGKNLNATLQIRRGNRDILGIIVHSFP